MTRTAKWDGVAARAAESGRNACSQTVSSGAHKTDCRSDVKAVVTRARPRLPIAKSANTGHVVVFFFARFLSIFSSFPAVSPFAFSATANTRPHFHPEHQAVAGIRQIRLPLSQ